MKRDQITRLKVLERDNYTCQCCGFFGKETHHKKLLINGGEDEEENMEIVKSFVNSIFVAEERHIRRINKIKEYESTK